MKNKDWLNFEYILKFKKMKRKTFGRNNYNNDGYGNHHSGGGGGGSNQSRNNNNFRNNQNRHHRFGHGHHNPKYFL